MERGPRQTSEILFPRPVFAGIWMGIRELYTIFFAVESHEASIARGRQRRLTYTRAQIAFE